MILKFFLFLLFIIPGLSWSACSSPAGVAGQFYYVSGDYKFCNNTIWESMSGVSTTTACSSAGAIIRSGNDLFFCNGSTLVSLMGTATDGTCTTVGMITYDSTAQRIEICNGTNWTYKNKTIVAFGSGKRWSDATYAVSCNKYRSPDPGYAYAGSTGDGVYTIDPDGGGAIAPIDVYCDMTIDGGGWTLVAKNYTGGALRPDFANSTTTDYNPGNLTTPGGATAGRWRYSIINLLFSGAGGTFRYYVAGSAYAYYKRLTSPTSFNVAAAFFTWDGTVGTLNSDFQLFSTYSDMNSNVNAWSFCNYASDVSFPRDCGPSGAIGWKWMCADGNTPAESTSLWIR